MTIYRFGDQSEKITLVQPIDRMGIKSLKRELTQIRELTQTTFSLTAIAVDDWNRDLSPWSAPPVFGKEPFGDGAKETLDYILEACSDQSRSYILGGYSLAGLFCLWAACETDRFSGIAAASPSVWFPNFTDHLRENKLQTDAVYLSLGDAEAKAKNPTLATVSDCIEDTYTIIKDQKIPCILEWNPGNHFKDPDLRCAKAFAWIINNKENDL